ncbi:hypothetical protein L1887_09007 [Cichorium endivia]|nr:hypothetical protein L1887_09007 [Cichorium endivia]
MSHTKKFRSAIALSPLLQLGPSTTASFLFTLIHPPQIILHRLAIQKPTTWKALTEMACSSSSSSTEVLIQTLINRGWCLREIDQSRTQVETNFHGSSSTLGSLESELCNMDLRAIGGKSLPDLTSLRKSIHFDGHKVLHASFFFVVHLKCTCKLFFVLS